ncbi:hypothetical protein QLL95_gp0485 [Cotonvirus japonicus]|uniref:Ankyrin repeat protein n=1 Tax=Cotonvirus japonicus TaxID=2811091 RepID=A0ABM7NTY5_9VIRU|nr:hypothetical protein QLL95_gp0485 [Cotonvirus japonicus]BCS83638.1 hypothetical protein [Cotonvirus japonicus]
MDNLYSLLENDRLNLLELLLEKNIIKNNEINTLFLESYKYSLDIVEILVNYGTDVSRYGQQVLEKAGTYNNQEVIDYLQEILN